MPLCLAEGMDTVGQQEVEQCQGARGSLSPARAQQPPSPLVQGAVVGLLAGLAMAFWVGIGSLLQSMGAAREPSLPNSTVLPITGNLTTAVATTLLTPTLAPQR